jgi:Txe/YoeB family toxin of toxin-antitoxin system
VSYEVVSTKRVRKDAKKLRASGLGPKAKALLVLLAKNPNQTPPPYEKLVGDLAGAYSRRINIQNRLVYEVIEDVRTVRVLRLWTRYE